MKSRLMAFMGALAVAGVLLTFNGGARAEEASFLKVPVGVNYMSTYWWRGVELNGKGVGVIWPSAGLGFGDTGLALSVAAGINSDSLAANESGDSKKVKTLHETDYGISYSTVIADMVSVGIGAMFIHYYYHDAADSQAADPSFYEASLSLGLSMALNPKLDAYYDYYIDDIIDANGEKNPKHEDYYIRLSISQELLTVESCKFIAGAWAGYYNNAYLDAAGFSDAGIKFGTSMDLKGVIFTSSVNYARSLSNDFQADYDPDGNGTASKLRNHFWAEFGASYTL